MEAVVEISTDLSVDEKIELAACEQTIRAGFAAFQAAGEALEKIRAKRLYRESYSTFEKYCNDRWNINRCHAGRLIAALEVAKDVSRYLENVSHGIQIGPTSERQIRPLANLPPCDRGPAFEAAADVAAPQPPTSGQVAEAVRSVKSDSAFEAGQKVTVVSPHAPAAGELVEVIEVHPKKPIVIAKTADGERRTYLKTQLSGGELPENIERTPAKTTKADHLESAQFLAQVTEERVQQLETLLRRAVPLLAASSQQAARELAAEAQSLLGV